MFLFFCFMKCFIYSLLLPYTQPLLDVQISYITSLQPTKKGNYLSAMILNKLRELNFAR